MKRVQDWIDEFGGPLVGTALCFIFYIGVLGPIIINARQLFGSEPEKAAQAYGPQKYLYVPAPQDGDDALATYTLWRVLFTAILAVSTIGLWMVTAKTLGHAQEDAARQAADTKISNDAAI